MQYIIIRTITMICSVMETAAFIYCLLSWIAPQSGIYGVLEYLLEPFVRPFRPLGRWIMEKTGIPLDFSFMFFLLALYAAERLAISLLYRVL